MKKISSILLRFKKSWTTTSSSDPGLRVYIPGRSISSTISPKINVFTLSISTVTPYQFATFADAPLIELKKVDFPEFGIPISAIFFITPPL